MARKYTKRDEKVVTCSDCEQDFITAANNRKRCDECQVKFDNKKRAAHIAAKRAAAKLKKQQSTATTTAEEGNNTQQ